MCIWIQAVLYFRQFADWLRKVALIFIKLCCQSCVEETEILSDMLVNFRDFAVETHFVVAICSGDVRHFPQGPRVDRLFVV